MAAGAPAFKRLLPTVVEQRGQEAFEIGIGADALHPMSPTETGEASDFPFHPTQLRTAGRTD